MKLSTRLQTSPTRRLLASVALAAVIAVATTGCKTLQPEVTGALEPAAATPPSGPDARTAVEAWGERYRAKPNDADTAINYAQALRAIGQRAQAVAVLEQASLHNPGQMGLLGAYGRALADIGSL